MVYYCTFNKNKTIIESLVNIEILCCQLRIQISILSMCFVIKHLKFLQVMDTRLVDQ